ncbi:MAG: FAD/NAD(P)-binding protein [Planctomycetota bacterium]
MVSLRIRFTDDEGEDYSFVPGQFNMVHGPDGDAPISIVAGNERGYLEHCIRAAGNATREIAGLHPGEFIGLRGPFGRGWPIAEARGKDLIVVSGGIGGAAVVSAIEHVEGARDQYGRMSILQGVRSPAEHIYDDRYLRWSRLPHTRVLLASMEESPTWQGHTGMVTDLFDELADLRADETLAMICGPEVMIRPTVERLLGLGLAPEAIYVSLERNMQCGIGHCGHCQIGSCIVCRDGPVFTYAEIKQDLSNGP